MPHWTDSLPKKRFNDKLKPKRALPPLGRYTGNGSKTQPVGIVEGQEYVVNANIVNAMGGPGNVEQTLAQGLKGKVKSFQTGGSFNFGNSPTAFLPTVPFSGGTDNRVNIDGKMLTLMTLRVCMPMLRSIRDREQQILNLFCGQTRQQERHTIQATWSTNSNLIPRTK